MLPNIHRVARAIYVMICFVLFVFYFIYYGLVTAYGVIEPVQLWFTVRLDFWRHQAITWTNVE